METHGATGQVLLKPEGRLIDGSVLRAAKLQPTFPCFVVEVDGDRYALLVKSVRGLGNVTAIYGDCNAKIDEILGKIPKQERFVFSFLDPDGLVYEGFIKCHQLKWKTVEKIASFPRTEVLINFPLEAIKRLAGYCHSRPEDPVSRDYEQYITDFYGTEEWKKELALHKTRLLEIYKKRLKNHYKYAGGILIRSMEKNLPLYYLVFASNNFTAAKIMRDIMRKEFYGDITPLSEQPIEDFVYED